MTEYDYLKEDDVIDGQKYVYLSLAAPNFSQKSDKPMVIFHGMASSDDEVQSRIQFIHSKLPKLNIYHAPIGKWLPWCDDDISQEEQLVRLQSSVKQYITDKIRDDTNFAKRRDELKSNKDITTETIEETNPTSNSGGGGGGGRGSGGGGGEGNEFAKDSHEYLRDNEKYICVTFMVADNIRAIKIRGVYNTVDEANKASKALQDKCMCDIRDKYFDINVAEMGRWLPFEDRLENIETHYADNNLNQLMQNYQQNQEQGHNHLVQMESDKIEDEMKKSLFETEESTEETNDKGKD